jgi:YbbR domain-containing protein
VSLITEDWRLKLLALGLSVLMLGAVAFSQNPPTTKTVTANINYAGVPPELILINPPQSVKVTVTGLADVLTSVSPTSSVIATPDFTGVKAGPAVKVNVVITSVVGGITITNPSSALVLDVDQRATVTLPVTVRLPRGITQGWSVTTKEARCPAAPCSVTYDGPTSWESNLKAYADFPVPVENSTYDFLTQPVLLEQNGKPLDPTRATEPTATLNITTVTIHVEAITSSQSRQVTLIDSPVTNPPPAGYRVTNVVINPITVVISGPADALSKITTIALPPLDLTGHTSDFTFNVQIPYPNGVTGSVATAHVTYSISANPNASG